MVLPLPYVFQTSTYGVGYYLDDPPAVVCTSESLAAEHLELKVKVRCPPHLVTARTHVSVREARGVRHGWVPKCKSLPPPPAVPPRASRRLERAPTDYPGVRSRQPLTPRPLPPRAQVAKLARTHVSADLGRTT